MIQKNEVNCETYFKNIRMIHGAFIVGLLNFGFVLAVLYFIDIIPLKAEDSSLAYPLMAGVFIFYGIAFFLGQVLFKRAVRKASDSLRLADKVIAYRDSKLLQTALLEGAALFALTVYMLFGNILMILVAFLSVAYMVKSFPRKTEIIEIFKLAYNDQQKLNNPKSVLIEQVTV